MGRAEAGTTAAVARVVSTYDISSVEKLTIVGMKFSRTMMPRMVFQSGACSPSSRQMDSRASFTGPGGLAIDRISTKCCFLMPFTATQTHDRQGEGERKKKEKED